MSIISEISRIENASDVIKAKTVSLSLNKASGSGKVSLSDKLDVHAAAINSIPKGSNLGNQKLDATTTAISIPAGYYGSAATVSVDTMTAPTIALSGTSQTISCDDKMMDGDITIPAANLFYTGSTAPTSSTPGNDGDLYLVL